MRRLFLIATISLLFCGCMTEGPLYEQSTNPVTLEMASYELIINDRRSESKLIEVSIPGLLGYGNPDFVSPTLDSALEERAHQVIEEARSPGSRDIVVTVELFVGCERFMDELFLKKEFVKWKLRVQVSEKGGEGPVLSGIGESWGRRASRDAPTGRLREMYLDSFAQAFHDALSHLEESRADH